MNDKQLCRRFLIAPPPAVVSELQRNVSADSVDADSVDAVVAALKRQPHPWDMTPLLQADCLKSPDFQPTLRSAAERSAVRSAYDALTAETQSVLANYHTTEKIVRERNARATFIFDACTAICNLYGAGHKPILKTAKNILYQYRNIRSTHDPEDLLQVALEKLHVNFYKIKPLSYRGWLIQTMKTYARDTSLVERRSPITASPITATDAPESDGIDRLTPAMLLDRQLPPHTRAIICEALDDLKTTLHAYFSTLKTSNYRSRFKKVAVLLLYEFDDAASQAALAEILRCSPQSVLDWRKAYLCELPSVFRGLTQIW